jgi:hypothetical protein
MSCSAGKFNFSALTDTDFRTKVESIIKCMEGRPDFPEVIPSATQIRTAVEEYKTALDKSADETRLNILKKIAKRSALENLLLQLPAYCENAIRENPFEKSRRTSLQNVFAY